MGEKEAKTGKNIRALKTVVVQMRNDPHELMDGFELGPQLVALFGKVMELLGMASVAGGIMSLRAGTESVRQPQPRSSLPSLVENGTSQLPALAVCCHSSTTTMDSPSITRSPNELSLPEVVFGHHSNER